MQDPSFVGRRRIRATAIMADANEPASRARMRARAVSVSSETMRDVTHVGTIADAPHLAVVVSSDRGPAIADHSRESLT